jgi:hypothetical protein
MGLLPLALLLVVLASGAASAAETIPERIVWQKEPIRLHLTVGKERRVDFPGPVKVGLPPQLESMMRVQSIAGTVYLLAHDAFEPDPGHGPRDRERACVSAGCRGVRRGRFRTAGGGLCQRGIQVNEESSDE